MESDTFIKVIDYGDGHDFTKTGRENRKGKWAFEIRINCGSGCAGCDNCTEEIARWPVTDYDYEMIDLICQASHIKNK